MRSPREDAELLESSQILITESRRLRAELDEAWTAHRRVREATNGYGLAFLGEASARLDARARVAASRSHQAIEDLF
jgi:hypothetical protein